MRFIITYEDDGYELRYWDEIKEEVGDVFAIAITQKKFYEEIKAKGVHILQKDLKRAFKVITSEEKPFVVLKSKNESSFENLSNAIFEIDEGLTYGRE